MADDDDPLGMCKGPSGLIFIFLAVLLVFIMFEPSLGESIISIVDIVLMPALGFDFQYPIVTLLLTAIIMIIFSSVARHFMIDWKEMAKNQKLMSSYQKEVKKAQKDNNQARLKKLQDMNPEILKLQQKQMMMQMKPMVVTMFVAIILFRWLYFFMGKLAHDSVSLPWQETFYLQSRAFTELFEICCFWGGRSAGGIPYWIGIYILVSIPIGQVLMRSLKLWDFSRDLKKIHTTRVEDVKKRMESAHKMVNEASRKGLDVGKFKASLQQAKSSTQKEEYGKANEFIDKVESGVQETLELHERTSDAIEEVRGQYKDISKKRMKSSKVEDLISKAKDKLKDHNFDAAIGLVKVAEEEIKKVKKEHGSAQGIIDSIKSFLYDYKECDDNTCEKLLREMEDDFKHSRFDDVSHKAKIVKKEAKRLEKEYKETRKIIDLATKKVREASEKDLKVHKAERELESALREFDKRKYETAQYHAQSALDKAITKIDETKVAQEELSLAKLVISNAEDFGADVERAKMTLISAERYFEDNIWHKAIELAQEAKDMAEKEKKRAKKR
jgi:uncharacterized membrane protein (DUF106 family)/HEPN domain-containing protein